MSSSMSSYSSGFWLVVDHLLFHVELAFEKTGRGGLRGDDALRGGVIEEDLIGEVVDEVLALQLNEEAARGDDQRVVNGGELRVGVVENARALQHLLGGGHLGQVVTVQLLAVQVEDVAGADGAVHLDGHQFAGQGRQEAGDSPGGHHRAGDAGGVSLWLTFRVPVTTEHGVVHRVEVVAVEGEHRPAAGRCVEVVVRLGVPLLLRPVADAGHQRIGPVLEGLPEEKRPLLAGLQFDEGGDVAEGVVEISSTTEKAYHWTVAVANFHGDIAANAQISAGNGKAGGARIRSIVGVNAHQRGGLEGKLVLQPSPRSSIRQVKKVLVRSSSEQTLLPMVTLKKLVSLLFCSTSPMPKLKP
ncbi:hypothetical protein TYRP_015682 [Tyrophagus putrescentiae]|nr:hypothetical protein TYRP_015682 [Tyrophagus putrescentiae]